MHHRETPSRPTRPPLLLIADAHQWAARSLDSVLAPLGYQILQVHSGPQVLAAAAARQPDAIVLYEALPDLLEVVDALRADAHVSAETPILLATPGPPARPLRVAALRAGVSDVWGLPLDRDELVLRLEAQLRAKFAAERAREEGLVDQATGLYNRRGLTRRARDLAAQATRRRAALACVVFAPDLATDGAIREDSVAQLDAVIDAVASGLSQAGRASDAIGRLGLREFAVLAPNTDPNGALRLGTRLGRAIEQAGAAGALGHAPKLRAGYHGVDDFHAAGLEPLELVARATSALRAAEAQDTGGWIHGFQGEPRGG
jgi:diguanylate cyclase (GGDEF)-like protein